MTVRAPSPAVAAVTAAALVTPLIPAIAPTAEASPYAPAATATVDQGDLIFNEATGRECAVGWLKDGYAFTAGQCGTEGDLFQDIDNNYLGTFETRYDPATRRNDFGWIKLDMEVAEGANRFNEVGEPLWGSVYFATSGGQVDFERYHGFDGATGVAGPKLGQLGVTLGQPVFGYGLTLVGLYTGELDGYSLITRPDQIAESSYPVDAQHIATRRRDDETQHALVFEFDPAWGEGSQVDYPPVPVINQGDVIARPTGDGYVSRCTVGWIADDVVFTAGHCGRPGMTMHAATMQKDDETGKTSVKLGPEFGVFQTNERGLEDLRNDVGWIHVDTPWVQAGQNIRSGDRLIPFEDITNGLEVCAWGMTTQKVRCGKVLGTDGAEIVMDHDLHGEKGDSGGPVWAKNSGGLVGIYSGSIGAEEDPDAYPTASRPDFESDNQGDIDYWGILRSIALGVPYYQLFPLFRTSLGIRGEEIQPPYEVVNQGDPLFINDIHVCDVGYVEQGRLLIPSECGSSTFVALTTTLGHKIGAVNYDLGHRRTLATVEITAPRIRAGVNAPESATIVPWEQVIPGDTVCVGSSSDKCTTFLGHEGATLVLEEDLSDNAVRPGAPLTVPGKGFVGILADPADGYGIGVRTDMVDDPANRSWDYEGVALAFEANEPHVQQASAFYFENGKMTNQQVAFPKRTFQAGEQLYDWFGNATCKIARVDGELLYVSSECTSELFTRFGALVGHVKDASDGSQEVAVVPVVGKGVAAGQDTATPQVDWQNLKPGDRVCAGNACTTFAGYDGSKLVLAQPLNGVLPDAALYVKGKGFAGIYHGDGIGSRPDMVEAGYSPSYAAEIRAAHRKGEQFYAHNDANFWSVQSGKGGPVPFPNRTLDEGTLLYDASGNPTCQVGRVDKQKLYVSSNCDGAVFTAAGEYVGKVEAAPYAGERGVAATIEVTGRRMQPGTNVHAGFAAWDAIAPGDVLCSDAGCGEFIGLDGANIVHAAPVPAQPGAALWNPELGFVGVSGGPGKTGSRIDMVTETGTPEFTDRVLRARELGTTYYQRATARFWDGNALGSAVPFGRHPAMNQGDMLYDASGTPSCTIGYIDGDTLFTSSECGRAGDTLYSAYGEELGTLEVPAADTSVRNKFGYLRVDSPYVPAGSNAVTGNRIAKWDAAQPGDEVCTVGASGAKRCGTYLGQDGSAVVLSKEVAGERADLGGPVWIPGKGFLAVYSGLVAGSQTGARIDMLSHDSLPANFTEVTSAFERNGTYYQKAPAHYFSLNRPYGERVPFPKQPAPSTPVPAVTPTPRATPTSVVPSRAVAPTSEVAPPSRATPTSETAPPSLAASQTTQVVQPSNDRTGGQGPVSATRTGEPANPSFPSEEPQADGGSADGSSTGGIIAAIVIPLVLIGLGFLATQFIDMTQFGLPPMPKILPI